MGLRLHGVDHFQKKHESISSGSNTQLLRPDGKNKESAKIQEAQGQEIKLNCRFIEAEANPTADPANANAFDVVLIQEGMGNFGDCYYYTREALDSAVPIFEGKKFFADHPDAIEERARPERSVRDVAGHFEGVHVATGDTGLAELRAKCIVVEGASYDWVRALMKHAVEFSKKYDDKDFVGLSINACGDSVETSLESFIRGGKVPEGAMPKLIKAQEMGVTSIRPVSKFDDAKSCDLVTEAGAGGRIAQMLEQEKDMSKKAAAAQKDPEKKPEGEKKQEAAGAPNGANAAPPAPAAKKDDGGGNPPPAQAGGTGDKGQDDAAGDGAVIKSMLDKYLGPADHDEATVKLGSEAYQAAKGALGMNDEEAQKCAGYSMKLAKHFGEQAAKAAAAGPAPDAQGPPGTQEASATEAKGDELKESERNAALAGENEALKAQLKEAQGKTTELEGKISEGDKKVKLAEFVDKTITDAKFSEAAAKRCREALAAATTEEEVTKLFKTFKEGFESKTGLMVDQLPDDFVIAPEKLDSLRESKVGKSLDFSDCAK